MAPIENEIAEEIRTLIARDPDIANAWDDERVVREAECHIREWAGARELRGALAAMPDYWLAVVQQARRARGVR